MLTPENAHYRLSRRSRSILVGVLALLLLVLGALWWNNTRALHLAQNARAVAETRADLLNQRTNALLKANHRLLKHGQQPVEVPNVPVPSAGPAGPTGPSGTQGQRGPQ